MIFFNLQCRFFRRKIVKVGKIAIFGILHFLCFYLLPFCFQLYFLENSGSEMRFSGKLLPIHLKICPVGSTFLTLNLIYS